MGVHGSPSTLPLDMLTGEGADHLSVLEVYHVVALQQDIGRLYPVASATTTNNDHSETA